MRKEVVIACFQGGTEEKYENFSQESWTSEQEMKAEITNTNRGWDI